MSGALRRRSRPVVDGAAAARTNAHGALQEEESQTIHGTLTPLLRLMPLKSGSVDEAADVDVVADHPYIM